MSVELFACPTCSFQGELYSDFLILNESFFCPECSQELEDPYSGYFEGVYICCDCGFMADAENFQDGHCLKCNSENITPADQESKKMSISFNEQIDCSDVLCTSCSWFGDISETDLNDEDSPGQETYLTCPKCGCEVEYS